MMSKFRTYDYNAKPHLWRNDGRWLALNSYSALDRLKLNGAADEWARERNRPKPKHCPVPLDDVCDYGRAITLNDDPGRNPHGPFN